MGRVRNYSARLRISKHWSTVYVYKFVSLTSEGMQYPIGYDYICQSCFVELRDS